MIRNSKLFFFFLLCSFFILPSFFFLTSPSQSAFVTSPKVSRVYPADNWTLGEKHKTLSALSGKFHETRWLTMVSFGLPKLKFKSGGQDVVYYFDKLALAFQGQILKQKNFPTSTSTVGFDYTQIQGEARKQLLQPYQKGTINFVDGFKLAYLSKWNEYGDLFLDSLRPSLLKMKVLDLSQVKFPNLPLYLKMNPLTFHKNLKNVLYKDLLCCNNLETFALFTFSPIPNSAKTVLNSVINGIASPWLHILQKASGLGLTHITVGKERIDVSSLVSTKVQEASALSLANLEIIKKLQPLGLEKLQTQAQSWIDTQIQIIFAFQKNWDGGKVSSYLFWLPVFDIKEVKLSQNKVLPVEVLATAIQTMLTKEKFDFTKLEGEARKQLLNLLNSQGKLREEKTFQDDVWKQIKNHQKWKTIEGLSGQLTLESMRILLLKVQDLGISKVSHPFFPEGYDLSFLQDNPNWEKISFQELLQRMTVKVNDTYVEFYSHLFPDQVVFQVPMKKLVTVFSEITITNIITALEKAISDHPQQEKQLETKNKGLIIGLSVAGSALVFAVLGGSLYWFFKVKK